MPTHRCCATLLLFAIALQGAAAPSARDPELVLWVWERPEQLDFLEPSRHGVAVLVGTVRIDSEGVRPQRRRQPASWPAMTAFTAVVRIEATPEAQLTANTLEEILRAVDTWAAAIRPETIQIDFDARRSERTFYRLLLERLRAHISPTTKLEITALASWCLGDPWIAGLPIDDAVPMLFRLGADAAAVRSHLEGGGDFTLAICRNSVGLSLDEPIERTFPGRRTLLFSPTRWSATSLDAATTSTVGAP